jgi:uncharacterized protein
MTAIPLPTGLQGYLRQGVLPPVEDWHPVHCGDSLMLIAPDGTWFHQGRPIARPELVRLFSTLLRKDEDGFVLVTPAEKLSITVEDAPFQAVLLTAEGSGRDQRLRFTTNVGDQVTADRDHKLFFKMRGDAPVPYLHVRRGLTAKAARPVYYQLAELAVTHQDRPGVWSGGIFFPFEAA